MDPPETAADPSSCVVLVPVAHRIVPGCDEALRQLERAGHEVRRVSGCAAIDQARSRMATDALRDGFAELMWIDSDVVFEPAAVGRLRRHRLPFTCGLYPQKGRRAFAANFPAGAASVPFGAGGGLHAVDRVGFGFVHTRREAYDRVRQRERLPTCNTRWGEALVPYFLPMAVESDGHHDDLAEDYAFCERARRAGFTLYADTTVRLWHVGDYPYGWEDAGRDVPRHGDFRFHIR